MPPTSWEALLKELRQDNCSGATALSRRAAEGLPLLAQRSAPHQPTLKDVRRGLRELATVRPPIAALFSLANEAARVVRPVLQAEPSTDIARLIGSVGQGFASKLTSQHEAVVRHAAELIADSTRILTTSFSSLVRDTVLLALRPGLPGPRVTCLESRPAREGLALASELVSRGVRGRVAVDAAAGRLMRETDLVLLGGDTLCATGLIHKVGTLPLALAARDRGVPVLTLVGTSKLLPRAVRGWEVDGGTPEELGPMLHPELIVSNAYFDLTPWPLLAIIVTENGAQSAVDAVARLPTEPIHPWLEDLLER